MENLNVLLILAFLFFCQIGNSQINPEIISKVGGKYYYQGEVYFLRSSLKNIYKTNLGAIQSSQSGIGFVLNF